MKRNDTHIEELLHAFYEGVTTPEEEQILYAYFEGQDISEHLQKERDLFRELYQAQSQSIPANLGARIESLIDTLEREDSEKTIEPVVPVTRSTPINWKWVGGIAASLLIVLSVGVFTYSSKPQTQRTVMVDTFSDPEEAYVEAQKALLFVSNKLNKGLDQMEGMQKQLERTNKVVEKNIHL